MSDNQKAASILRQYAGELYQGHTIGGRWDDSSAHIKAEHDELLALADRLALGSTQERGEAVAWMWDYSGEHVTRDPEQAEAIKTYGAQVTPLYAHPAPAPATAGKDGEADNEAIREMARERLEAIPRVIVHESGKCFNHPDGSLLHRDYALQVASEVIDDVILACAATWAAHPAQPVSEDEPLTCDDCGAATDNPWHSSEGERRHYHRCDACHAKVKPVSAWVPEDHLKVQRIGGALVVSIGEDTLLNAIRYGQYLQEVDPDNRMVITDKAAFLDAVIHELLDEEEDGTTLVHRCLDGAAERAIENGAEGIHLPPAPTASGEGEEA